MITNETATTIPQTPSVKVEFTKEFKLPTAVLALEVTPDGARLYAACLDGRIYEVDPESGEHRRIGKHQSYASGVCLLDRAQVLISAGYDGVLQWHDLAEPNLIREVRAHHFWSWKVAVTPDEGLVASATGQYLAGGYKYEPAEEQEPSVKVFDARSGELTHSFSHVPPVLSLAFSPNGKFLAAGNMMGEVRVWELGTGQMVSNWTTPDFTSWGTVKSHHYIGGIFDMQFTPDGQELLVCGMGPMSDPMAGNGKQTWQRFAWRENPARKTAEIIDGERGTGLMESVLFHPQGKAFLMSGRLAQGKWNTALFDHSSGKIIHSLDCKMRVTSAKFGGDGRQLILAGAVGQERNKDGKYPEFGRLKLYTCAV